MKTTLICTLTLALLASGAPRRAEAGDKERAFVAGVIGGAVLRHAISGSHPRVTTRHISTRSDCSTTYRRASHLNSARSISYLNERVHVVEPSGYYETRHVKVWVPGYREKFRQSRGTWVIRDVPGRYEVRRQKVWVENRPYRHRRSTRRVVYTR